MSLAIMLSPYAKLALLAIRLAACGLILMSLGLYATDVFLYLSPPPHGPMTGPGMLALKAVPALAGAALFWKSKGMAIRLTKDLD
jgi:hypothetical protein